MNNTKDQTEPAKKRILDILLSHSSKAYGKGSCGELGDQFTALDYDDFSRVADEILNDFEPKEDHEDYLKAIDHEQYVKDLKHFKDSSVGLNVTDKPMDDLLRLFWQRSSDACPLECSEYEAELVKWQEWVKSVSWTL